MDEQRESEIHRLIGGDPCLDFANTINGHTRPRPHEYLHDYEDLVLWGRHARVLSTDESEALLREAIVHPAAAVAAFRRSLELRDVIFRIFSALADHRQPDPKDLIHLTEAWRSGQEHACLVPSAEGFNLGWEDEPCLESLQRSIADSAIHLLISPQVHQVRSCAGDRCDWLFVDTSRNHLRRWCSMDECGNHAKMQRRQLRKKNAAINGHSFRIDTR